MEFEDYKFRVNGVDMAHISKKLRKGDCDTLFPPFKS